MERNDTPLQIAKSLRGMKNRANGEYFGGIIGLTSQQVEYVENARAILSDPERIKEYLTRNRKTGKLVAKYSKTDKRAIPSIAKAIREGRALDQDKIDTLILRLNNSYLNLRAQSIAEDESITALRAGRHEGYRQLLDDGKVREDQIIRTWSDTGDGLVRLSHAALDDQEVIGMSLPFVSPITGARMMFPGDGSLGAPQSELRRCRCFENIRIRYIR